MKKRPLGFLLLVFAAATNAIAVATTPFESGVPAGGGNKVDGFVVAKLRQLGIPPANPCSDGVFVRRVFLDVIGTLPTAEEAESFINDKNPGKRSALIDRLLERNEFADYWGMKWGDVLRVKSEFPVNLWPDAAQAYDHWIRDSIRQNIPYSDFVWELLTASGSNFRSPQVNFFRSVGTKDPKALARAVAQTFMGEKTEGWSDAKVDGMAAFFSQIGFKSTGEWKEEIVYYNGFDDTKRKVSSGLLPNGEKVQFPPNKDPRELFARWLVLSKDSPMARTAVNRLWYWLLGRGIIHEPDDCGPKNPPSNPQLLSWLAGELVSSNYDMKHIFRLILNSNTYQFSSLPASKDPKAAVNFASYPLRRLDAEVVIDAINQITGGTDEYSSQTPEPFTWVPVSTRTIALPDGSITSAFLDLFGRPPRDTGLLSERNNHVTAGQRLHLLNSGQVHSKVMNSKELRNLVQSSRPEEEIATRLYLTILSRYPSAEELESLKNYSNYAEAKGIPVLYDLAWALMNSSEFLFHH